MFLPILTLLGTVFLRSATALLPENDDPGLDLAYYVSRPEIRAPLMNVTRYEADAITPGYWFMAPYANLLATSLGAEYTPFQAGPLIFDNRGELVWSASHLVQNRNSYDFKLTTVNGSQALTFILDRSRHASTDLAGAGIILDTSYQPRGNVSVTNSFGHIDLHEFNVIKGETVIIAVTELTKIDMPLPDGKQLTGWIYDHGLREIEIATGKKVFEWLPFEYISPTDSMVRPPKQFASLKEAWDCYHTNSIDKTQDGDYIVSMRYMSTIFKISGVDGSVIWRLGGKFSYFLQDFNFSSQHDARIYSYNSSVTIISFLDNASDEHHRQASTARTSAIKIVALYEHTSPMTAKLLKQYDRPDGGLTMLRGSAQVLPNDGIFAGWSEHGYISEFTPDGRCVLEAKYVGTRFSSYRAYKFDFVGQPTEPPALKTHAYGSEASLASMSSVFYVSWNGATEVASWGFYGTNNLSLPFQNLGSISRSGFETTFFSNQFWAFSYAEAFAANGSSLGSSPVENTTLPNAHIGSFTLEDLIREQQQQPDRNLLEQVPRSVPVIAILVFVGLVSSGLALMLVFFWKRWTSQRQPIHSSLRDFNSAIEVSELETLTYADDKGENESEDDDDGRGRGN